MLFFLAAHVTNGLRAFSAILRRRLLPSGEHRSNSFAMNLGALCALAGLAAHSVVDFNMHIPGNALLFAFIFGMLANPGIERTPSLVETRVLPWGRLLLPALGAWMLWSGLPLLPSEYCAEQARIALRDHNYLTAIDLANLGLGRTQGRLIRPPAEGEFSILGQPWSSYAGIDAMVARFGPNPRNPDLYFYLGEANRALAARVPLFPLKRAYFEPAILAFQEELKIFPQDENGLVRMAQCLDGMRRFEDAERVYEQCFQLDPHLGSLYGFYATHLLAEGNKTAAAAALKTERDLDAGEVDAEQGGRDVVK